MLDRLTTDWSRPYKIVRVMQALGMDVPQRLRCERLALLVDTLAKNGIEACLPDESPIILDDSPGIEAKIRLRLKAPAQAPPVEFGYEVVARIPTGGMSECFKVRGADGSERFLKKVPANGVQADALRREMEIYQKLNYSSANHVVLVHDVVKTDDGIGLILELAEGGTLEEYYEERETLDVEEIRTIALEVLEGLHELHSVGIVHRDLKPQNVLRAGEEWKLADFGISKNLAMLISEGRTFQGRGTAGYSPPEQWEGREAHTSADVYAFGKLLVFLLTGNTDVDKLVGFPTWSKLIRRCINEEPASRPSVEEIRLEMMAL